MKNKHANFISRKASSWSAAQNVVRGVVLSSLCCLLALAYVSTATAATPEPVAQLITADARGNIAINNAGTLAYTNAAGDVLTITTGGTVTTIAQAQDFGTPLSAPQINDNDQVAFALGSDSFGQGVALNSGGSTTVLANTSTTSPSGGTFLSFPAGFSNIGLNAGGDVAFPARAASGGTFLASGGGLSSAAVVGDSLGAYGTVSNFCGVAGIDNTGRVISAVETSTGAQAIVASVGGSDVVLVASGDPAPGGGTFGLLGCATVLANTVVQPNGLVVFFANANSKDGIFGVLNGQITRIVTTGQNLHGGLGKVQFFSPSNIAANDNCQIAFRAGVEKANNTLSGLFTYSANGFKAVALEGDAAPDGGTFAEVAGGDVAVAFANGYLAFRGATTFGTQGAFLAAPAAVATCGEF
jgi:hypothetical protein